MKIPVPFAELSFTWKLTVARLTDGRIGQAAAFADGRMRQYSFALLRLALAQIGEREAGDTETAWPSRAINQPINTEKRQ